MKKDINLYIHIPYCTARCKFCSFFVIPGKQTSLPLYFKALEKEILTYKVDLINYKISTIYLGGGTPSLVDGKFIVELINFIKNNFEIDKNVEITLEANPENVNKQKFEFYINAGVNRLSFGVQAWQNELLSYLGRLYKIEKFIEIYNLSQEVGFKNINLDLIFGIPNQSLKQWEESLDNIINCNPTHISCYSLEVDDDSTFGILKKYGKFFEVEEQLDRKMYKLAQKKLYNAGFKQYEISNFAKIGYKSRHNNSLWEANPYIGIGASAHSNFNGKRYHNANNIERYLSKVMRNKCANEEVEILTQNDQILQFIIVQLRLIIGIDLIEFKNRFKKDLTAMYKKAIDKLILDGLIIFTKNRLKLTARGFNLENKVALAFIN